MNAAAASLAVFVYICHYVWDRRSMSSKSSLSIQGIYCNPCFSWDMKVFITQSTIRRKRKRVDRVFSGTNIHLKWIYKLRSMNNIGTQPIVRVQCDGDELFTYSIVSKKIPQVFPTYIVGYFLIVKVMSFTRLIVQKWTVFLSDRYIIDPFESQLVKLEVECPLNLSFSLLFSFVWRLLNSHRSV